jgi:hypothetical protein
MEPMSITANTVETETPKAMRLSTGISRADAARMIGEYTGHGPYTYQWLLQVERDGTDSTKIVDAMAHIYKRPLADVLRAFKSLREKS